MNRSVSADTQRTRTRLKVAARKQVPVREAETKTSKKETSNVAKKETEKQPRKEPAKRQVAAKPMDVSLTIGIVGVDIQGETFDKVADFINQNARMGIITLETGDDHLLLHIQGMISIKASSTRSLKADLRSVIGWDENAPPGASICVKALRDRRIHTVIGIIGYCLKDEHEEHFRIHTKNISEQQKEDGRRRHVIYGASEYKNVLRRSSLRNRGNRRW
ncbi:hypothetical protein R1flu_002516 [Riccia fluitans]|uniref:Replitron HUH endonuclease domain-containing protein n=1 Tax=Riccia fluitans TaxID=41844 RepID=A0ABD1Y6B9_9MARC